MEINIETFSTKRLQLKKITPEVYHHFYTNCSDDEIKLFFALTTNEELEKEKQRVLEGNYAQFKNIVWFQILLKETNEIIGYCGFHFWNKKHYRAEIGYYIIDDKNKQKGYMTEAVEFVIDYGFNTMQLNRIEAFVAPEGFASLKILSKFGFEKEGYCKGHYYVNDVAEDSVFFALLNKNYQLKLKD